MKKKDKISLLIYKKADNTITKKELKKLNKYLEKHSDLNDEYVLIKNIKEELKNYSNSPLPDDFKVKLREKLVDYNLNNAPVRNKKNLFKINITATAVLAVFLIAFSFGINYNPYKNTQYKEVMPSNNYKTSQSIEDKNGSLNDENSNNKEKTINESKNSTSNPPVLFNENIEKPQEKLPKNEEKKENTPAIAVEEYKVLEPQTDKETVNDASNNSSLVGGNSGSENVISSGSGNAGGGGAGGGGGGSSMATSPIYDFSHSVENIVIITNCDNSLFNDIKMEEIEKNIFKIDIKEYSNVINILNNVPYEIKNFSEKNVVKSYFYLVNEK